MVSCGAHSDRPCRSPRLTSVMMISMSEFAFYLNRTLVYLALAAILPACMPATIPAQSAARKDIYHDGWIDLNKNGRRDTYEDPKAPIDARVEDLLRQMTLE